MSKMESKEAEFSVKSDAKSAVVSDLTEIVRSIHASDTLSSFVEAGCGVPVANALLSVPKASSTVLCLRPVRTPKKC